MEGNRLLDLWCFQLWTASMQTKGQLRWGGQHTSCVVHCVAPGQACLVCHAWCNTFTVWQSTLSKGIEWVWIPAPGKMEDGTTVNSLDSVHYWRASLIHRTLNCGTFFAKGERLRLFVSWEELFVDCYIQTTASKYEYTVSVFVGLLFVYFVVTRLI